MSDNEGNNPFSLGQASVEEETSKAVLFHVEDLDQDLWVPKSVLHDNSKVWQLHQDPGELVVKQWWAEKNQLI